MRKAERRVTAIVAILEQEKKRWIEMRENGTLQAGEEEINADKKLADEKGEPEFRRKKRREGIYGLLLKFLRVSTV